MPDTNYFRVCMDRTGDEYKIHGFTLGFRALDEQKLVHQVVQSDIKYAFRATTAYPLSRYGDGSWPVYYTAEDHTTAAHEVAFHDRKGWIGTTTAPKERRTKKIVYNVKLKGKKILPVPLTPHAIEADYTECNRIARQARVDGYNVLRAPSARRRGGVSVPVFDKGMIEYQKLALKMQIIWDSALDRLFHTMDGKKNEIALWHK